MDRRLHWVNWFVILSCFVAGCTGIGDDSSAASRETPSHSGIVRIPLPVPGEHVELQGPGAATIAANVVGISRIGPPEMSLSAIQVHYRQGQGSSSSTLDEFVDGLGSRLLSASRCPLFGNAPTTGTCTEMASATVLDAGLPAGLGSAVFWGKELRTGQGHLELSFLGAAINLSYVVKVEGSCARIDFDVGGLPTIGGAQRFGARSEIPSSLTICEGSSLPTSVEYRSATFTGKPVRPDGNQLQMPTTKSPSPWSAEGGERIGLPRGSDYDPSGFAASEAVAWWKSPDGPTIANKESARLRSTLVLRKSFTSPNLAPEHYVNSKVERALDMEIGTKVYRSTLVKECVAVRCTLSMTELTEETQPTPPPRIADARSRSLHEIFSNANKTLGVPLDGYGLSTVMKDVGQPDVGHGDVFVVTAYGSPPSGSLPYRLRVNAATGVPLSLEGPWGKVAETFGLPE